MEEKDTILTFDTLYTTNEIQLLKLALPLLSPSLRPFVAIIIKGKELKYCMEQLPRGKVENASVELQYLDVFLDNALPYCSKSQKQLFMQLKNFKKSLDMFEKMKGMMDLMEEDTFTEMGDLFQFLGNNEPADFNKSADSDKSADSNESADSNKSADFNESSNSVFNQFIQNSMSDEQAEMFAKFKKQFEEATE